MSDFSLTLVLQIKTSKIINDMAKVHSRFLGPVIDKVLGFRCTSFGYQYGEIVGSLSSRSALDGFGSER